VLGALSGLVGLLLLFANVLHDQAAHDVRVVTGHVVGAVAGLGLLIVARQLRRGKRRAWAVASTLYACAALGALLRGPDPAAVAATAGMLIALVWHRDAFAARPDPGSLLDLGRFLMRYTAGVLAFGAGTLALEHDHIRERLTVGGVLETIGLGLAGARGPYEYTGRFLDAFFPAALLALGLSGLVLVSVLAFRAVRATGMPGADERERARALVLAHGSGTLDYFALRDDKRYFFAAGGDALIAYGFLGGTALVSGDPIGTAPGRDRVVGEFLAYCRERGWQVAFLGARERDLPLYRRHGLRGVYLGDEAVVRCDRFSLETASKSVRAAVGRVGRECTFELLRENETSPALRAQLNALRERWLGEEDDRGFTMELGGGVRGQDPRLLLALASGADGRPLGFLRLVPCCGDDEGWSLDLMQHDPEAPNGMTEYLIAMCATELGARGFRRLSLNFATWGRLFADGVRLNPVQRIQRRVGHALSPHFQITSLRDFNAKFDPQWVPRTILVEDVGSIPKVGLLYAALEGFIRLPLHRH
jgi:lysyl-tRNA synthetase class 2